jgi:4-amino-4-deoxy-L-arabinose transferase-like glycosyltransferase
MSARATLGAIVIVALCATTTGLTKSLPYSTEADEPTFVNAAVHIAATGDLNPHWFGHPGATVIYPLAVMYRLAGPAFGPADLQSQFATDATTFYMLGRWLSVAYRVLAVPVVFLLGRATLGTSAGLIGAWLTAVLPIAVAHAQVVRTDSPATLFGLVALWQSVRIARCATWQRIALGGLAVGLAIATRYFMLALVPVLLSAVVLGRWSGDRRWLPSVGHALLALATVALGFILASPFALLDRVTLERSLTAENETNHVGADGLSPIGNFSWYLSDALPSDLTYPVALVALVGAALIMRNRQRGALLLLGYAVLHLVLISASALHWHRWTIQILPIAALCCGYAIQSLEVRPSRPNFLQQTAAGRRQSRPPASFIRFSAAFLGQRVPARVLQFGIAGVVSLQVLLQLLIYDAQQAQTPARVLAREWMAANVPADAAVTEEWYGPPLDGSGLHARVRFSLAEQSLQEYARSGLAYLVASSAVYDRYFAEPDRYAEQVSFYQNLIRRGQVLAEFRATFPGEAVLTQLAGGECNCSLPPVRGTPGIRIVQLGTLVHGEP